MSLLEKIQSPADLARLSSAQLDELCEELRGVIIQTVSHTGGHLASNLGVVELTVALHRLFSSVDDRIVWDVGHQCYAHKLLTGRAAQFEHLRKSQGISGFPRPQESPYDTFVAGHSSTSVSAANGLAKAKTLTGESGHVIAVIGDGAMTGGLAYEGLCNAGRSDDRLIVVLNDNKMSINQNVGFVARHLSNLRTGRGYQRFKNAVNKSVSRLPVVGKPLHRLLSRTKMSVKQSVYHTSTMFEEMGFYYLGPIDGHNLNDLCRALEVAKTANRPVLLHAITEKGHGYAQAVKDPDVFHGVSGFDVETGTPAGGGDSFSKTAGDCLCETAEHDDKLCVVTAAMTGGTGLSAFAARFPDRFFDVGIAEEHATTFLSGLAVGGCLPVFAVYSTFLQRAYDQLLNDTAIMNNHVVLAVDRAGIVPDDGETHQGLFDVSFLSTIPHTTIYSPATYEELALDMKQALYRDTGIVAVRYPRGAQVAIPSYKPDGKPFAYFRNVNARTLIVTYGRLFSHALEAVSALKEDLPLSVLKLTRVHPLPAEVLRIAAEYQRVIFFEEGNRMGGVAQQLGAALLENRFFGQYEMHTIDRFIPACSVDEGLHLCGLDTEGMIRAIRGGEDRDR